MLKKCLNLKVQFTVLKARVNYGYRARVYFSIEIFQFYMSYNLKVELVILRAILVTDTW